jgi:hypothetical protein
MKFCRGLNVETARCQGPAVFKFTRPISWRSNSCASNVKFRKAIDQAYSPERLLFKELPEGFGLTEFSVEKIIDGETNQFFDELNQSLEELANATPTIRRWARDEFLKACKLPASDQGWALFVDEARILAEEIQTPSFAVVKRAAEAMILTRHGTVCCIYFKPSFTMVGCRCRRCPGNW